ARWGRYERTDSETLETDKGNPKKIWKRTQVEGVVEVSLQPGNLKPQPPCDEQPEVTLQGVVRARGHEFVVTLFLVNAQEEPDRLKDEKWLFQPEMIIEDSSEGAVFIRRRLPRDDERWDLELLRETQELEMLYRRQVEFAVGHGISVHAESLAD